MRRGRPWEDMLSRGPSASQGESPQNETVDTNSLTLGFQSPGGEHELVSLKPPSPRYLVMTGPGN